MSKAPGKRRALTRQRILAAALSIVDREGVAAVSMRRVGEELAVEAMSLYNHVESKAAILDGLFEVVLAELPPAKRHASWQAALRERALAFRAVLRTHPNAIPLFATRPAVTPASLAYVEAILALLDDAGFRPEEALKTLQVLVAFVVGHTASSHAPPESTRPAYEHLDPDAFPRVRAVAARLGAHDVEKEFLFGLEAMIAGIASRRLQSE